MAPPLDAPGFMFGQLTPPAPPPPPERLPDDLDPHEEAMRLVGEARADAVHIREAAQVEGLAEGRRAGLEQTAAELHSASTAMTEAAAELRRIGLETADKVEREAVLLGLQVAEKVLAGAIAVQPARVVDVVRGALRCLVERDRVLVLMHPGDMALVRDAVEGLRGQLGGIEHLEVQEERRMIRGGAMVRSRSGEVDARIETKLQRAREVVEAELERDQVT